VPVSIAENNCINLWRAFGIFFSSGNKRFIAAVRRTA